MINEFTIGKKYLIKDIDGIFVTATISFEDETKILFKDRDGLEGRLLKKDIQKWKEVEQWTYNK